MFTFKHRQSSSWHKQIDKISIQRPLHPGGELNPSYPWIEVREKTEQYLKSKPGVQEERDGRLTNLIHSHDAVDTAIAACVYYMSPGGVRRLFTEWPFRVDDYNSIIQFLQAICIASYANPTSIPELEKQRAISLLNAILSATAADKAAMLEILIRLLINTPRTSLLYIVVSSLVRERLSAAAIELELMRSQCSWSRAQDSINWMHKLYTPLSNLSEVDRPLYDWFTTFFPTWEAWLQWQIDDRFLPDLPWNSRNQTLRELLALAGPDFSTYREPNLFAGLVKSPVNKTQIVVGRYTFGLQTGTVAEKQKLLLDVFNAVEVTFQEETALYTAALVQMWQLDPVPLESFRILDMSKSLKADDQRAMIIDMYYRGNKQENIHVDRVKDLLLVFSVATDPRLKIIVGPYLVQCILLHFEDMQRALGKHLLKNDICNEKFSSDFAEPLISFGALVKQHDWILPQLDLSLKDLLAEWPNMADVRIVESIAAECNNALRDSFRLTSVLQAYLRNRLIRRGDIEDLAIFLTDTLCNMWSSFVQPYHRYLALYICDCPKDSYERSFNNRLHILTSLSTLEVFIAAQLSEAIKTFHEGQPDVACIKLIKLLSEHKRLSVWKPFLLKLLELQGAKITQYMSKHLTIKDSIQCLASLAQIFPDNATESPISHILCKWAVALLPHSDVLYRLEDKLGREFVFWRFVVGCNVENYESVISIFQSHADHRKNVAYKVMLKITSALSEDASNAHEVSEWLKDTVTASKDCIEKCNRVMSMAEKSSRSFAKLIVSGWLSSSLLSQKDVMVLTTVAKTCELMVDKEHIKDPGNTDAAADYLDKQVLELLDEAKRLEGLRVQLKRIRPKELSKLLETFKIEDSSTLDDAIAALPSDIADDVERVSDHEVEIALPLNLTPLKRIAYCVDKAASVVIRLVVVGPPSFCVHLRSPGDKGQIEHESCIVKSNKQIPRLYMCKTDMTRCTFPITRLLWRYIERVIKADDSFELANSIEYIHNEVSKAIPRLGTHCMVCGRSGVALQRATICAAADCKMTYKRSSILVRISDVKQDPAIADLLLTSLYAVGPTNKAELAPFCPVPLAELQATMNTIPNLTELSKSVTYTKDMEALSGKRLDLLSWVVNSYRGFLVSTTQDPRLKIPSFPPNTHQFILANASPDLEGPYNAKVLANNKKTTVLFHGTSLDRLYAILRQGLKICSNTALMRTAAAHGSGIYMADEPATSWSYSTYNAYTGGNWTNSSFRNMRVLLGCELAGTSSPATTGIHVIKDPSRLMVRYVFLMPQNSVMPVARHITPAMTSVFSSLRSGAL